MWRNLQLICAEGWVMQVSNKLPGWGKEPQYGWREGTVGRALALLGADLSSIPGSTEIPRTPQRDPWAQELYITKIWKIRVPTDKWTRIMWHIHIYAYRVGCYSEKNHLDCCDLDRIGGNHANKAGLKEKMRHPMKQRQRLCFLVVTIQK